MFFKKIVLFIVCLSIFLVSGITYAQELVPDQVTMMKGRVLSIEKEEVKEIPGISTRAEVIEGEGARGRH